MRSFQTNKGFTLIELIIVIAILSILTVMGINSYTNVRRDARNSKRKADLKELKTTLASYYARNNEYPSTVYNGGPRWFGLCNPNPYSGGKVSTDSGPDGYIPNLAPEYIPKLPHDPRENRTNPSGGHNVCRTQAETNCYLYRSDGIDYKLLAHCTPEGTMSPEDTFFDQRRPTWAWTVYSSSRSRNW